MKTMNDECEFALLLKVVGRQPPGIRTALHCLGKRMHFKSCEVLGIRQTNVWPDDWTESTLVCIFKIATIKGQLH